MISIALMYWHFVDIIWLVVLLLLYSTHSFDLYSYRTFFYY
jgi:heme/copper-type cytochrome/quinol oxidase subunit 3